MENEINLLREYFDNLSWVKRQFFPKKFAEKLKNLLVSEAHNPQKLMSLCEALFKDTNKLTNSLFYGLSIFYNSPKVKAYQEIFAAKSFNRQEREDIFRKILVYTNPIAYVETLIKLRKIKQRTLNGKDHEDDLTYANEESKVSSQASFSRDASNEPPQNKLLPRQEKTEEKQTLEVKLSNKEICKFHSSKYFRSLVNSHLNEQLPPDELKNQTREVIKNLSPEQFSQLCYKALEWGDKAIFKSLVEAQKATQLPLLEKDFLINIIDMSMLFGKTNFLKYFKKTYPELISQTSWAKKLMEHVDSKWIQNIMQGYQSNKGENPILESLEMQLIFAAKQQKKQLPIAVFDKDNLSFFLENFSQLIGQYKLSLKLPFTYFSDPHNHCISGLINVVENKIEIAIIEPAGLQELVSPCLTAGDFIKKLKAFLPTADIYCSVERIQRDKRSCTLIAVDNAIHLCNADAYIPQSHDNFFDYLKQNVLLTYNYKFSDKSIEIKLITLPLRFLRLMQSLAGKVSKEDPVAFFTHSGLDARMTMHKNVVELWEPVNKRGETVQESLDKYITHDPPANFWNDMSPKRTNLRIEAKLKKYRKHVFQFLLSNNKNYILDEAKKFTPAEIFKQIEYRVNASRQPLSARPMVRQE